MIEIKNILNELLKCVRAINNSSSIEETEIEKRIASNFIKQLEMEMELER